MMIVAMTLVVACSLAPLTAQAASKRALERQKAVILTELDRMRIELQGRIDEYTSTGREMQQTQDEIDTVSAQLAEVETQLAASKKNLAARAAALYRGDRVGMITVLLSSQDIEDLIVRTHYLMLISERDAQQLNDARLTQSESLWLRDSLNRRLDRLRSLQARADAERADIQSRMDKAQARAIQIDADLAEIWRQSQIQNTGGDTSGQFDVDTVVSDANFRSQDMTATGIQDFLDRQSGPLKDYQAADHNGVRKSAAQMIADAAKQYNISPRVILVTLQKEQSLLSKRPSSQSAYDWAMGAGATDSGRISKYKGFGNQVWYGAQFLDKNTAGWHAGITKTVGGGVVHPTNRSTYSLYMYTPHMSSGLSFWTLWIRYFNDNPAT